VATGHRFALKRLAAPKHDSAAFLLQCRELETHLRANDHPNIVTLHHVIEHSSYVIIVMDYCAGGDLQGPLENIYSFQIMNNDPLTKRPPRKSSTVLCTVTPSVYIIETLSQRISFTRPTCPPSIL
jgi:serine/threonine protein kinase